MPLFSAASALFFRLHPCRVQLLLFICIFIHLAFISTTISRPGEGNRLLPLKREGRRGAYADRDDDVSIGFLSLLYLFPFLLPKGTTLTSTLCLFCPSPSQLVSFFPKPLSKKTQPSVSFALFRANFICYLFSLYLSMTSNVGIYYLILYCTFSSKPTKWYTQKTVTPFNSGITVCNL